MPNMLNNYRDEELQIKTNPRQAINYQESHPI